MYSNLFILYKRKLKPRVGMRLPSELVTRHSLDPSLLPHGLQHFLLHQPLPQTEQPCSCAPLSTQRLPAALTPCFLPTWSPVLRCSYERDTLSPHGRLLKWWCSPPRHSSQLITAHHAGHSSHHFCFLPRPPALVMGPLCSAPPTSTHPALTFSSGLLTAFRKQAERARGSSAKQSRLGHGNPGANR